MEPSSPATSSTHTAGDRAPDQLCQAIFEAVADALLLVNDAGLCIDANPSVCHLLGLDKAEMLGRSLKQWFNSSTSKPLCTLSLFQKPYRGNLCLTDVRGALHQVEYSVRMNIVSGQHLLSLRELPSQSLPEPQCQRELGAKDLLNSIDGIVWEFDLRTLCFSFVSPQAEIILGYPLEQWYEPGFWLSHMHPDDRAWAWEFCLQATRQLQNHKFEYRMFAADGSLVWLQDSVTVVIEADKPVKLRGVMLDVSDRKTAEAGHQQATLALRHTEATNRALLEVIPDLLVRMHRDGTYLDIILSRNHNVNILGADRIFRGSHISAMLPPDIVQQRMAYVELALQTGEMQRYEYQINFGGKICDEEARILPVSADEVLVMVRDITDHKVAERQYRQQAERDQLLFRVTQQIRQSLDITEILTATVTEVRQLLEADRVLIYQFNKDWSGKMIFESVAGSWTSILGTTIHDPCFSNELVEDYRHGRINVISDIRTTGLASCYTNLLSTFQVQANLAVPVIKESQLWGLICVHQCRSTRQWQPWEIEFLTQLANQVAIAIQQAQLYQQVQQLNAELEYRVRERMVELQRSLAFEALLRRITDTVRDSLDQRQILQAAVQELATGLAVPFCNTVIYSTNSDDTVTNLQVKGEFATDYCPVGFILPVEEFSVLYSQLLQGLTVQLCVEQNIWREPWVSLLLCPISDKHQVIGDILLLRSKEQAFSQQEIRLVEQVANQCAIALRQSRLYEESQAQVKELERLNGLKDDFLNTVSHELRTPMSNIKMATQMLELALTQAGKLEDNSRAAQYLQILNTECQRETDLINDLLDLSRLEAGADPLLLIQIDLQTWIPAIAEPFEQKILSQKQHLQIDIPPDLPPLITDLNYLERILQELLQNACKYTPAEEVIQITAAPMAMFSQYASTSPSPPPPPSPTHLQLRITNTGTTISPQECDRIFEKFYRIPNNDPWKHSGTGLGLALVKRLVEQLQGSIGVESTENAIHFTLLLPLNLQSVESPGGIPD